MSDSKNNTRSNESENDSKSDNSILNSSAKLWVSLLDHSLLCLIPAPILLWICLLKNL